MTPLHQFGEMIRSALGQVPLPAVRVAFIALLAGLLVWVLCLPKSSTRRAEGSTVWYENLKVWASLALIIQIVLYGLF